MLQLKDYVMQSWVKANQRKLEGEREFKNIKSCLRLFKDQDSLVRSKGRISNSSLPYNSKCPILLNRKQHYLTKLNVLDCHNRVKYNGQRHTLAEVRSLYWITMGKKFISSYSVPLQIYQNCPSTSIRHLVELV